jgi:hypothetical protein
MPSVWNAKTGILNIFQQIKNRQKRDALRRGLQMGALSLLLRGHFDQAVLILSNLPSNQFLDSNESQDFTFPLFSAYRCSKGKPAELLTCPPNKSGVDIHHPYVDSITDEIPNMEHMQLLGAPQPCTSSLHCSTTKGFKYQLSFDEQNQPTWKWPRIRYVLFICPTNHLIRSKTGSP